MNPAVQYHADAFGDVPTLSSSIAKIILARTPKHAWTAHPRLNPQPQEDDAKFDLGSAAHEIILGAGAGIDVCDFADWRSKDAKAARAASRAVGRTPMLAEQYERAKEIAFAALEHPAMPKLEDGRSEIVILWQDAGGPMCRAMLDWWDGAGLILDVKTTDLPLTDAALGRQIVNMGYDLSAAFYIRGLVAGLPELAGRIRFRWLFVETSAPFGCRMIEATNEMLTIGDRKAALAIAKWHRCLQANDWPGWPADVGRIELPAWVESQVIEREMTDADAGKAVFADRCVLEAC